MANNQKYFERLTKLKDNAYVVYSKFPVAAIVETDIGDIEGVNVENISFGLTNCAERTAIFTAVTKGAKKFNGIHIWTGVDDENGSPCGACRQVMSEFFSADTPVHLYNAKGFVKTWRMDEILPLQFATSKLG